MSELEAPLDVSDFKIAACIACGDRITNIHVSNLLGSHGIVPMIEGGLVFGISVPAAEAELAAKILREDAQKLGYYIAFGANDEIRAVPCKRLVSRISVSSALKKKEFASGTALGQFLRSKDISQLTAKFPYIISIAVHERQYLTWQGYSTGYEVEISLQKSLRKHDAGCRGTYQICDNGQSVTSLGSTEWPVGDE